MAAHNKLTENVDGVIAERHLRRAAVQDMTGLSRSSIYAMMDSDDFPRPIRIGKRAVAWPQSAIEAWLANRPTSQGAAG